ncbi:MAG: hypothetical protein KAG04_01665, partial [Mycoplasmataceae bacterium]|nr:hypothetical protein [Mycoplasmataceae bacterium]
AGTGSEMDYFYDKNFHGITGSKGKAWSKSQVEEHLKGINMFLKASATKNGTIKVLNEASSGLNDKNIADDSKLTKHTFAKPVDFMMLQEVDRPSVRSLYVDEPSVIAKGLPKYDAQFVNNFKVGILPVPVMDPMGQVDGGLMTLSKYKINNAKRISLKSTDTGLVSIFDLKRAIGYTEYNVSDGKKLHMANIHMSAFSGDAVKRAKEYQTLLKLITTWKVGGDYVIIGGDWNSDITDQYYYSETKDTKAPNFLANAKKHKNENFLIDKSTSPMGTIDSTTKINYSALSIYDIAKYTQSFRDGMKSNPGYKLGADTNLKHPTMRMAGENWKGFQAKTYNKSDYAIIDGFLVSGNVEISTTIPVKTLQQGWHKNKLNPDFPYAFADSDHNPVVMHFQLKTTP